MKATLMYQQVSEIFSMLQRLKVDALQLPDGKEAPEGLWEKIEAQMIETCQRFESLGQIEKLKKDDYSEDEWAEWRGLVDQTKALNYEVIQLLTTKKESFYKEVRSVGQSMRASRAYNDMKRIRF